MALRFFTVHGPRQRADMAFHRFMMAMLEGDEVIMCGVGTQTRDFAYVDDIVARLVLARGAPSGIVMNLGGGNRVSLAEAIATLGEVVGVEPKVVRLSVEAGDVRDAWADSSSAPELIAYSGPSRSLIPGHSSLMQRLRFVPDADTWTRIYLTLRPPEPVERTTLHASLMG